MATNIRERLIFHGAIVMLVGLLFGFLAVLGLLDEAFRGWRAAHLSLTATGIWILVMAAISPSLVLEKREFSAFVWSLLAAGYGFMMASPIQAITGVKAIQPTGPLSNWVAFIANTIGLSGAMLVVLLTIKGAHAALKKGSAA